MPFSHNFPPYEPWKPGQKYELRHIKAHQRWMADRAYDDPFLLLASYMGSGKTVSVLTVIARLFEELDVRRVLIVAPLLVAEDTWPAEIELWEHTKHLRYELLTGNEEQRLSRMRMDADIYIINREKVVWLWNQHGKRWPYDMVVWDESSRLKKGSKRTPRKRRVEGDDVIQTGGRLSEFGALCSARKHVDRLVELTGTPAPNGVQDLWGQIYPLDLGRRLGMTKTGFYQRHFIKKGFKEIPKPGAEEAVMEAVRDIMVCLREEDYADLPPLVRNTVHAPLPAKGMAEYKKFEKTLFSEEYDIEAVSKGVLTNKLLQFSNGSLYNEEGNDLWVHDAKIKALEQIVEEANGQSLLVAYSFKFDLKRILKRFPKARVLKEDSSGALRDWNAGKVQMLLVHPASAGHGLNLQKGGHIAVWYGLNWSLELYQQLNKRLHRGSQTKKVFLHHIIAPGTIDETVMKVLTTKGVTQDSITDAVRIRLEKNI